MAGQEIKTETEKRPGRKPELLAPAGDPERLRAAVAFGADAVYMGGGAYGLRAKAKNFSRAEMAEGVALAHDHGVKVYVTANIYAHNADFAGMAEYFRDLQALGVDALLISDLGVFSVAREAVPEMELHVSTQANTTNVYSARAWYGLGARRVVAARELSLPELTELRAGLPADCGLEVFCHGAMCVSYSGRCLLSAALTGQEANRGACTQPCRWKYALMEERRPGEYFPVEEDSRGTYLYNARDLCMIDRLPELLATGADSLKIEGRMKTAFYVGTTTRAYREALDDYFTDPALYRDKLPYYRHLVGLASHRAFSTGFFFGMPGPEGQSYADGGYVREADYVAVVTRGAGTGEVAVLEQRNRFFAGETLTVIPPQGAIFSQTIGTLTTEEGEAVEAAPHPRQVLLTAFDRPVEAGTLLCRELPEEEKG